MVFENRGSSSMYVKMSVHFWALFVLCCVLNVRGNGGERKKMLLVSMDGFRWDYLNNSTETPNFDRFAQEGVQATYMEANFPTVTFPNHFTMITGLYSESNGITENYMYDPVFNASFSMSNTETRWWDGGEPLWVTAKKQGLRTGTYYWPGSETEIQGIRPDFWFPYSDDPPYLERVDTVIDWFVKENVTLATLYYPEPDKTGHSFGPDSIEVRSSVMFMDGVLGYLMQMLKLNNLEDDVDVIVTSDHGMTDVDVVHKVVDLYEHVDRRAVQRVPSFGAVLQLIPEDGMIDAVVANLSRVPHIRVFRKSDVPERYHYKANRRIMPVVVVADEGWLITTNRTIQAQSTLKGQHGYDNGLPSMRPIFLARGPNFKKNMKSNYIENVDIYPLICELLSITPAPNNGSLSRVTGMLQDKPTSGSDHPLLLSHAIFGVIVLVYIMSQSYWGDCFGLYNVIEILG